MQCMKRELVQPLPGGFISKLVQKADDGEEYLLSNFQMTENVVLSVICNNAAGNNRFLIMANVYDKEGSLMVTVYLQTDIGQMNEFTLYQAIMEQVNEARGNMHCVTAIV